MPQPTLEALAAEFKKKYPFLNVEIERQQGLAAYEKFAQETRAGANLRDVVHVADLAGYQRLVADGMILQYRVPTDARFQPAFRIGDARAYIPYKTEIVVPVNDQLVSRAEGDILKTWEGILDPRWKGRVGMVEPAGGTTYAIVMMLLHSPQPNRFGEDFLRKLAEHNPTIYSTTATAIQRLLAGDVHVLFTHWESDALTQLQKGAPIRWYAPSPTPSYGNSPYGISAKAPHANAAKLWQNWFMGEEGARALNTIYNSKSTLDGFTNVVDLPKTDWYMPIQDSFVPAIDDWAKYQTADVDRWSQIFNYKMGSGA
jgi:iron(III) transport system substrate-binding protein